MAIKLPDPGLGDGQTGDNEYVMWTKVKDNFADQSNAASRLVGTEDGNVAEVTNRGIAETGFGGRVGAILGDEMPSRLRTGVYNGGVTDLAGLRPPNTGVYDSNVLVLQRHQFGYGNAIWFPYHAASQNTVVVESFSLSSRVFHRLYSDMNTNKGTNGVLSEKSPVSHLYHDRVEHTGNEKELQPIKFVKQGVGNYLLKNTTGLAQEGWYIVIPHDANGNPLIAVEYEDNDGDINIRTYKRKFDFEQAKVVADHDNPMDIPETRWIDLRFNDDPSLYEEVADEPIE